VNSPWKIEPGFFGTGPENIHVIKNFIDEKDVERGHHIQRSKALESVPEDGL
jgi:hypothetical protein